MYSYNKNNDFDIVQNINGDSVIGFTSVRKMETSGWFDRAKVSTFLMDAKDGKNHTKHLGMIGLYQSTHRVQMPMMADLFKNSAVLEVEPGQSVTYDLPVNRITEDCVTKEDTSNDHDYPGIDGGVFTLVLSHEYTKNDILSYDPRHGQQVIVSNEHEVERVGENFKHYVLYSTMDREAAFPKDYLKAGVKWMKVGHAMAEFDTSMSSVTLYKDPGGTITNEFVLGSPRGAQTFYSAEAARMSVPGLNAYAGNMKDKVQKELDMMGGSARDMFFIAPKKDGKAVMSQAYVGSTLEYLVLMELAMMEVHSLLFARAASFNTSNGAKLVNEGVWHQIRRGKIIKYGRPGGITFNHIHEAASYIFRDSSINPSQRIIKFKAGWFAYQNLRQLFREEAFQQANLIPTVMVGQTQQINGPLFTGPLNNLSMSEVAIGSVVVPGIGTIQVEHDESLDYDPMADRRSTGFYGEGMTWESHSLVIWDITRPEASNVMSKVKNADLVEGGSETNNIYYIKPSGPLVTYGFEQGRSARHEDYANIQSSMKYMGTEFWATSRSAALVLDTTRYVTIELMR